MWGKGLPGMGFGGCEASELLPGRTAGWVGEWKQNSPLLRAPLLVLVTPLTINKRLTFPVDGQTLTDAQPHTHRLKHIVLLSCCVYASAGQQAEETSWSSIG